MDGLLQFGEQLPEYSVRVLNEREARAGAGILFFLALVSFLNAWLMGDFRPTKVFVMAFLVDFFIRIFINPKYAPSLIIGRFFVRKQKPEYVGAPQKRFAWSIGLVLAITVFYLVVIKQVIGPVNLLVCSLCLVLLFFETTFGICIGCHVYNLFNKEKAQLCPGNACEVGEKHGILTIGAGQVVVVLAFLTLIWGAAHWVVASSPGSNATQADLTPQAVQKDNQPVEERCKVPDYAIAMGHAEKWKLHNNCK
jgi:hypothetical protein